MRASRILQRELEKELVTVHRSRVSTVFAAVLALVQGAKLTLTELGRAMAQRTSAKHGIKRVDRLLGNRNLQLERSTFYRAISHRVIARASRPVILVDWTSVTTTLWALVAAVPFDGRALTIYAEVHPISRYQKPQTNKAFLQQLARILPPGCGPTIVTDAGFRTPWMRLVAKLGWDYVCRIRHANVRIRKGREQLTCIDLWRRCRTVALDFGVLEFGARGKYKSRFVGIRKRTAVLKFTSARRMSGENKARRNAQEPWILATTLQVPPSAVVAIYRQRMQIEETFRDAKNPRLGLSLDHARTGSEERAGVLFLLASLTQLFTVLIGVAAELYGLQRRYQANTVRGKRVLSLARLGRLIAAEATWPLPRGAIAAAWKLIDTKSENAVVEG